ncbi:MAG: hypothetical protein SFX74_02390 [Fimbriimonadaceae bacterium]|nr:hypothetical protein [Fimbriimonadaceae bacterium]
MLPMVAALLAVGQTPAPTGVFTEDVVERIRVGKRVTGLLTHRTVYGAWEYRFASAENLRTFRQNPTKFAVQLGGACGRMGELSGVGRPELSSVIGDRLYIFASAGCQRAFVRTPRKYLEQDEWLTHGLNSDPAVTLRKRILDWAGGAARWEVPIPVTIRTEDPITLSGTAYRHRTSHFFGPQGEYTAVDEWNDVGYGHRLVMPAAGAVRGEFTRNGAVERIAVSTQVRSMERERDRSYWAALTTLADSASRASRTDAPVAAGTADGSIQVQMKGVIVTIHADPTSGAVKGIAYRGRFGSSVIGAVRIEFSRFQDWQGRKVPTAWTVTVDDKPVPEAQVSAATYATN